MIDLHCHILPALDDGAADPDDSLAMAAQAQADGITAICATPHIRHDHDVRIATLAERVADLNRQIRERGIGVEVMPGGEVATTALRGLGDDELELVALGSGRWILLEPEPGPMSSALRDAVDRLATRGFGSVIAHPERHLGEGAVDVLIDVVERGALVQVTAAFLERWGPDSPLLDLAGRGLVHVVASDAHSSRAGRPMRLSGGLAALKPVERVAPHLDWIAEEAPRAIVRGEPLTPPFPPVA